MRDDPSFSYGKSSLSVHQVAGQGGEYGRESGSVSGGHASPAVSPAPPLSVLRYGYLLDLMYHCHRDASPSPCHITPPHFYPCKTMYSNPMLLHGTH